MMNRIFSLLMEVVCCGFQIVGNHPVVVHLKETVQLVVHIGTLQPVDESVVQERVVDGLEYSEGLLAIGLHQIGAVAILIGEVVVA